MVKTFFVLWIWYGAGNTQTMAMDHFATRAECEAAKTAINDYYAGSWLNRDAMRNAFVCLEANVKE